MCEIRAHPDMYNLRVYMVLHTLNSKCDIIDGIFLDTLYNFGFSIYDKTNIKGYKTYPLTPLPTHTVSF
jgi:hypothetical protein